MGAVHSLQVLARADLSITPRLRQQLAEWLQEDLGRGDLTTPALRGREGEAHWRAKADGVFCGGVLLEPLFREFMEAGTRPAMVPGDASQAKFAM